MYKTLSQWTNPVHIVIHESFLLYFIPKIVARLEEAEASSFMKNASASGSSKSHKLPTSDFASASSFFLQSASASTKI